MNVQGYLSRILIAATVAVGVLAAVVPDATACGGFFCSRTPVDQTAERIIFSINDDETVTAYIQIAYQGDRDNFAWVVPVPGEVDPGTFPERAMTALDLATEPSYTTSSCSGAVLADGAVATGTATGGTTAPMAGGVMVIQEQRFGPFDSVTIIGDDAQELVEWLQDNGYRILDTMVPYIEKYVEDGMAFFAMRLLPDADVTDISPVKLTYAGSEPMIPIRLTTIASQPEMGVVTWVLAGEKYAPKNYADLPIPDELIEFDFSAFFSPPNNYLSVVSRQVDRAGGHAFVTEYAQPTGPLADIVEQGFVPPNIEGAQEAQDELVALLRSRPYITRMYTRMSAEEMTVDPYFEPASASGDVDNNHYLQCEEGTSITCECDDGSVGVRNCGAPDFGWYAGCICDGEEVADEADAFCPVVQPPSPCAFTYCGRAGACVPNAEGLAVCVCADGATARPRTTTAGALQLYCEPLEFNFQVLPDVVDPEALDFPDPCQGFDCGANGACTTMNGTATCRCDSGFGATVRNVAGLSQVSCEAVEGVMPALPLLPDIGNTTIQPSLTAVETLPTPEDNRAPPNMTAAGTPTQGGSSDPMVVSRGGCALSPSAAVRSPSWPWALGLLLSLFPLVRRRRSRRSGTTHTEA